MDADEELFGPAGSFQVTEPGRYDMPDVVYHADPVPDPGSLSSTGARQLLRSPKKFAYWRGKSQIKRTFDVGSAAHALVLGAGQPLVKIEGDGADINAWRTNSDKLRVRQAREAGQIPLCPNDYQLVHDMAEALAANAQIAELLSGGTAEEAFFAKDRTTHMWLRCKTDYRHADHMVIDYKTSGKPVDVDTFARTMAAFGYHVQGAFYRLILVMLELVEPGHPFLFIAQEKEPPYEAAVIEPDVDAMAYGHAEALKAIEIFQRCTYSNDWPGHPTHKQPASLPGWKLREYELAGVEPIYTDRVGLALERIADARTRAELRGVPIIFPDVKDDPRVKKAGRDAWDAMGAA